MATDVIKPPEGRTTAEVNCQLVSYTSGRLAGPACPDAHLSPAAGGSHLPSVQVRCPSGCWPPAYDADEGSWHSYKRGTLTHRLISPLRSRLGQLLGGGGPAPLPPRPLAWHPKQLWLAAVDSANGVQLFDYTMHVPYLGQTSAAAPPPLEPALVLQHDFQRQARSLSWRPNSGASLAVGCAHGACLWHLGGSKLSTAAGTAARSRGAETYMAWLGSAAEGPFTSLAWHPRGHLLAGACCQSSGLQVWDVATGACTTLRAGLEPVTLLRWSPCGSYLLTGHPSGSFRVWETGTWWSVRWAAADGSASRSSGAAASSCRAGPLVDAAWSPDSSTLLLAHANSAQLVSLNFTAAPPSLQAQLLPVQLPELGAAANGSNAAKGSLVQAVAWDRQCQRLAVALGDGHPAAGCIALYDTRLDPILSARFIGFVRATRLQSELAPEAAEAGTSGGGSSAAAGAGRQQAQRHKAGEMSLSFHPSFDQGALLAARSSDFVATVPMYFAA